MLPIESIASYVAGEQQLPTLHYIHDLISQAEEQRLLQEVHASKAKWVQLSGRRLQNHGGIVHSKGLIPAPMPSWLQYLLQSLPQPLLDLFPAEQPPNHVLINSYQPGCGIMPHEDGPLYHPVVLILSLGSPAVLRFWCKQPSGRTGGLPPVASLLAMPRSLLVFQADAYTHCLHGIEEVSQEVLDASVVNAAAAAAAGQTGFNQPTQQHHQQQQQGLEAAHVPEQPAQQNIQQEQHQVLVAANGCVQQPTAAAVQSPQLEQQQHCAVAQPLASSSDKNCGQLQVERSAEAAHSNLCCCGSEPCAGAGLEGGGPEMIDRKGERVSLTIRRVLKVHKALGFLRR